MNWKLLSKYLILFCVIVSFIACKDSSNHLLNEQPKDITTPKGMIWIAGNQFFQGAKLNDTMALDHEKPIHLVGVDGFYMDVTEVTNAQFQEFVEATNYITIAERKIDWEDMKKQLPEGKPKPHDSIFQPGSLTFKKTDSTLYNLYDFTQWWKWTKSANWQKPNGNGSTIKDKDNYPVVHIAYEDALAYCKWKGRRLPTEAEWEFAASGAQLDVAFPWGNDASQLSKNANTWEGEFPVTNKMNDGFERLAPVKSYPFNNFALYDMAGNVWEWTSDWYNVNYYSELASKEEITINPKGADKAYNPNNPHTQEKVIKGGSFLCNTSYCASYRITARMNTTMDSSYEHLGFRTVATPKMLRERE